MSRIYRAFRAWPKKAFPLIELHPDNGSEFWSAHLLRYFGTEVVGMTLSRSRPYQKNDNRFVEQKNDTLVRAYLGHERLDTVAQRDALITLYDWMGHYYNLFQPVMHLVAKEVIDEQRVRRRWDDAATPYQRLLATNSLDAAAQERLATCYATTNPRQLRREIHAAIPRLWTDAIPDAPAASVA